MPLRSERNYRIALAKNGTYAVEIRANDDAPPVIISGFSDEEQAKAWIESDNAAGPGPRKI